MKTLVTISLPLALLTFCVVTVGGTTGVAEKNGSCPLPPSYPACNDSEGRTDNQCTTDQQCPGEEKCCDYGCSLQCKKPVQEKGGSCQDSDRAVCLYVRPLPDECQNDSQCPGAERCCCRNCRRACSKTVKAGVCPHLLAKCKLPLPPPKCTDDGDCPEKEKCCSLCGQKCMDPRPDEAENAGFCPFDPDIETQCAFLPPPRCSKDADCGENKKCCLFGCGVQCVKALTEKPGVCPNIKAKCRVPLDDPQCQSDKDCPKGKKCCNLCGKKCLDSEPDNTGFCPSYTLMKCPAAISSNCSQDSECQAGQKCCDTGCGKTCMKTSKEKSGFCPDIPLDEVTQEVCNKCKHDKDCPGHEKCCPGAEGRQCLQISSSTVKAGTCPADTVVCKKADPDQCQTDGDCTGNQKCCYFHCGKKCKAPESVKAGTCPADTARCIQEELPQCQSDGDCTRNQKCCYFHCGKKCKDPESAKTGECPVPSTRCAALTKPQPPKCRQDSDCPGTQKCCTPLCTQECTDAILPAKTGECPVPSTRCAALTKPQPPKCRQDSDCPGTQKCCTPLCTQECTDAILPDEPKPLRCFQSVKCFAAPCPDMEQECAGPDDVCQLNQNRPIGCMSSAACNLRKAKDPSVTCCSSDLCNVAH